MEKIIKLVLASSFSRPYLLISENFIYAWQLHSKASRLFFTLIFYFEISLIYFWHPNYFLNLTLLSLLLSSIATLTLPKLLLGVPKFPILIVQQPFAFVFYEVIIILRVIYIDSLTSAHKFTINNFDLTHQFRLWLQIANIANRCYELWVINNELMI